MKPKQQQGRQQPEASVIPDRTRKISLQKAKPRPRHAAARTRNMQESPDRTAKPNTAGEQQNKHHMFCDPFPYGIPKRSFSLRLCFHVLPCLPQISEPILKHNDCRVVPTVPRTASNPQNPAYFCINRLSFTIYHTIPPFQLSPILMSAVSAAASYLPTANTRCSYHTISSRLCQDKCYKYIHFFSYFCKILPLHAPPLTCVFLYGFRHAFFLSFSVFQKGLQFSEKYVIVNIPHNTSHQIAFPIQNNSGGFFTFSVKTRFRFVHSFAVMG